eukprot:COSAG01_NODE_6050_length_3880_cov_4.660970_4_plen_333_part_00
MPPAKKHVVPAVQHDRRSHLAIRVSVRDGWQSPPVVTGLIGCLPHARTPMAMGRGGPEAIKDAGGAWLGHGGDAVPAPTHCVARCSAVEAAVRVLEDLCVVRGRRLERQPGPVLQVLGRGEEDRLAAGAVLRSGLGWLAVVLFRKIHHVLPRRVLEHGAGPQPHCSRILVDDDPLVLVVHAVPRDSRADAIPRPTRRAPARGVAGGQVVHVVLRHCSLSRLSVQPRIPHVVVRVFGVPNHGVGREQQHAGCCCEGQPHCARGRSDSSARQQPAGSARAVEAGGPPGRRQGCLLLLLRATGRRTGSSVRLYAQQYSYGRQCMVCSSGRRRQVV